MPRHLQYVGKKKSKIDNVLNKGYFWPNPGAVIPIDDNDAPHFTKYKDVWRDVTDEVMAADNPERKARELAGDFTDAGATAAPSAAVPVNSPATTAPLSNPSDATSAPPPATNEAAANPVANETPAGHAQEPPAATAAGENAANETPVPSTPAPIPSAPVEPTDPQERLKAIVVAIGELDPAVADNFTGSGKPQVKVLEKKLGWNLAAEERDVAHALFQDANNGV